MSGVLTAVMVAYGAMGVWWIGGCSIHGTDCDLYAGNVLDWNETSGAGSTVTGRSASG